MEKGRQTRKDEPRNGSDGEHLFSILPKKFLSAGTQLVTITGVVPARSWRTRKRRSASASFLEIRDMEVERGLARNSVVGWAKSCWNKKMRECRTMCTAKHSSTKVAAVEGATNLGSSGSNGHTQQHEDCHAEALGSSGRHDQIRQHIEQEEVRGEKGFSQGRDKPWKIETNTEAAQKLFGLYQFRPRTKLQDSTL